MLETPHVAVGIAIATKFSNPLIAIPLSFTSHFILDRIVHWNPHLYTETQKGGKPSAQSTVIASIDIATALVLGLSFAYKALPDFRAALLVLVCAFAAIASDFVKYPYYYFHVRQKWLVAWVKFERSLQVDSKSVFWGMVTQALVVLASIFWALA